MKLKIIFRACDKVFCAHEVGRPFASDKQKIIEACFKSLINSLQGFDYEVIVIGDELSERSHAFFNRYKQVEVKNLKLGGSANSIIAALDEGLKFNDEDWVYFCEDDYLHQPHFMKYTEEFIHNKDRYLQLESRAGNKTKWLTGDLNELPLFIHPSDYPDNYLPRNGYMSLLFLSKYCHWRQIQSTTHTFMTQGKNLKRYEKYIRESGVRCDDAYLSRRIYGKNWLKGKALCVSPMPGLAAHLTDNVMSPFVNWEEVFNNNSVL